MFQFLHLVCLPSWFTFFFFMAAMKASSQTPVPTKQWGQDRRKRGSQLGMIRNFSQDMCRCWVMIQYRCSLFSKFKSCVPHCRKLESFLQEVTKWHDCYCAVATFLSILNEEHAGHEHSTTVIFLWGKFLALLEYKFAKLK